MKKGNTYVLVAVSEVSMEVVVFDLPDAAPDGAGEPGARRQGRCGSAARAFLLGLAGPSPADGLPGVGPKRLLRVPLRLHLLLLWLLWLHLWLCTVIMAF